MNLAGIEAQLEGLTADELRRLAVKSWAAFVQKEQLAADAHACDEDDPELLAAVDRAISAADAAPGQGHSGLAVRACVDRWTSR